MKLGISVFVITSGLDQWLLGEPHGNVDDAGGRDDVSKSAWGIDVEDVCWVEASNNVSRVLIESAIAGLT